MSAESRQEVPARFWLSVNLTLSWCTDLLVPSLQQRKGLQEQGLFEVHFYHYIDYVLSKTILQPAAS